MDLDDCIQCGAEVGADAVVCSRCEEEFWDSGDPGVVPNTFDDEADDAEDSSDPR